MAMLSDILSCRDARADAVKVIAHGTPEDVESGALPAEFHSTWKAELDLRFERLAGKTRLVQRRHLGPLMVQSPFHPEKDGTCHVYLLHPPGGVAGGDDLTLNFAVGMSARALLTTPGATKFYCSRSGLSRQTTAISVAAGGVCEYFPQETILFDGAQAAVETSVSLEGDATYAGWDFFCLGRPAADERFQHGRFRQRIRITRDGRPLWFERSDVHGGSHLLDAPHAFAGQTTWGTMIYAAAGLENAVVERVREVTGPAGAGRFTVSCLEDVAVCRYLGPQASEGKALFARAWSALRSYTQGKAASPPRIWAT